MIRIFKSCGLKANRKCYSLIWGSLSKKFSHGFFESQHFFIMTQSSIRNTVQFCTQTSTVYFSVTRLTEEDVMNYQEEIIQAILIGSVVATFLLNIGHALKAIELCKENFVLLSNKALRIEKQLGQLLCKKIYPTMFKSYRHVSDHTNAIAYGNKLLAIYSECGDTVQEGLLSITLAKIYRRQRMYAEAKQLFERAIPVLRATGKRREEAVSFRELGYVFQSLGEYTKAGEYFKKALAISMEIGDREGENTSYGNLGNVFYLLGGYVKAREYYEKALAISMGIGDRKGEGTCYGNLGIVLQSLGKYIKAKEYYEKALAISMEIGDKAGEGECYGNLGTVFNFLGEYVKAKEYFEKALLISMEIGDSKTKGTNYGNLGTAFISLGEYVKAGEYFKKALAISMEIGDREGENTSYGNLGRVFYFLGGYVKAREYFEKALAISMEIGDRGEEGMCYGNLGTVFKSLGEYVKARECSEKALEISMEIGDRKGEGTWYRNLGDVLKSLGKYVKAREYYEKALAISMEIGDKAGEGECYGNLGTVFNFLGEYVKAKEYFEKALLISMEIGDSKTKGTNYGNLGTAFISLGEYVKAGEYFKKALAISMETGDRKGENTSYGNLGRVFCFLGAYVKAKECYERALAISVETGDREREGAWYGNLGGVFYSLGEYIKAKDYYKRALKIEMEMRNRRGQVRTYIKLAAVFEVLNRCRKSKCYCDEALAISMEIGDKEAEAICYYREGHLLQSLGDKEKAKDCFEKALAIALKMGDKNLEASNYLCLGQVFQSLGDHDVAEEYLEKALSTSKDIGNAELEYHCYCHLALTTLSQRNFEEAFSLLFRGIEKSEKMRGFLQDRDQMKISFADTHVLPYQLLSKLFCNTGNPKDALNVAELGRARALADLMAAQYSAEKSISADPKYSMTVVDNVMKNEGNCSCLYISYFHQTVFLWILKTSGVIHFREIEVDKKTLQTRLTKAASDLNEFFAIMAESFGSFGNLPAEVCEDRSITDNNIEENPESCQVEGPATLQQRDKPGNTDDPEPSLTLFYELLVHPVSDLLDEPEIIVVPDRSLYRVPFPALLDERGKHLSENFRIRVVPSLSTLKLIQDSPADYHSQTDALVVGDPAVGRSVIYRGSEKRDFSPLPGARKEAEMIGQRLGVQPLLGEDATKPAVLERIKSACLVHIAAHGNAVRGEIALAPPASTTGIPQEEDYLLKMSDIAKVQVRAKLVVLSCCHSGRGQIVRAEGVVGIARAFLGSGARSVLVALWALDDITTKKLMSRFYEHLVRGESASVSLHAAMKWMRDHGFTKVPSWAPFMLIGDDVTFAFEK